MPVETLNPSCLFSKNAAAELAHDAAVKLAISVAQLPRSTMIILQSDSSGLQTDILVKAPSDAYCALLAQVSGVEVSFADDPAANFVRR